MEINREDIILNSYDEFMPYRNHKKYYKNDKEATIIRLATKQEARDYFSEERSMQKQKDEFENESYYNELPE